MGIIYIAQPYSNPDPLVEVKRYSVGLDFTAFAIKQGANAFNPIVHCHEMARAFDMPGSNEFWKNYNANFLAAASEMWVLPLRGWEDSAGISWEVHWWNQSKAIYAKYLRMVDMEAWIERQELKLVEYREPR